MRTPVSVGVVGAGGDLELARALGDLSHVDVRWLCLEGTTARDPGAGSWQARAKWTNDPGDLLRDEQLDAVVFETPPSRRGGFLLDALEADKHVLVRGPLALRAAHADELVAVAARRNRRLRAYHPPVARAGVRRLRSLIERGVLGEIFYVRADRTGKPDGLDLLWGPGADLVALVLDLLADQPIEVTARAETYVGLAGPQIVYADLRFSTGVTAALHLSSLDAEPIERVGVVGSRMTGTLDLTLGARELSLHAGAACGDAGAFPLEPGHLLVPRLPAGSGVRHACERFVEAVHAPADTVGGRDGAAVVTALEAVATACGYPPSSDPQSERVTSSRVIPFRTR